MFDNAFVEEQITVACFLSLLAPGDGCLDWLVFAYFCECFVDDGLLDELAAKFEVLFRGVLGELLHRSVGQLGGALELPPHVGLKGHLEWLAAGDES